MYQEIYYNLLTLNVIPSALPHTKRQIYCEYNFSQSYVDCVKDNSGSIWTCLSVGTSLICP